jgi:hypothetical protein
VRKIWLEKKAMALIRHLALRLQQQKWHASVMDQQHRLL